MNHELYRQWLLLSVYEELDPLQQETLDEHLQQCDACRSEMAQLKEFNSILAHRTGVKVDDVLLQDARRQFRLALVAERSKSSIFGSIAEALRPLVRKPAGVALSGAIVFVLGILAGYAFFMPAAVPDKSISEIMFERTSDMQPATRIANVRIDGSNTQDGMLDLSFDAIVPMQIKGTMNDPRVQRVLVTALMSSQNPGVRFQTANMLASRKVSAVTVDADMKDALITALETDENPGVRKEALAGLQKFPFDDQVKRAYMRVLMKDKNSGMRIDVINALTRAQSDGLRLDSDVISVLQQKQQSDENAYIRKRATTLLEGVQQ